MEDEGIGKEKECDTNKGRGRTRSRRGTKKMATQKAGEKQEVVVRGKIVFGTRTRSCSKTGNPSPPLGTWLRRSPQPQILIIGLSFSKLTNYRAISSPFWQFRGQFRGHLRVPQPMGWAREAEGRLFSYGPQGGLYSHSRRISEITQIKPSTR